jgi:hypothetical protein
MTGRILTVAEVRVPYLCRSCNPQSCSDQKRNSMTRRGSITLSADMTDLRTSTDGWLADSSWQQGADVHNLMGGSAHGNADGDCQLQLKQSAPTNGAPHFRQYRGRTGRSPWVVACLTNGRTPTKYRIETIVPTTVRRNVPKTNANIHFVLL